MNFNAPYESDAGGRGAALVGGAVDYSFSDKSAQRAARLDLVGIAHDATAYPDNIPDWRLAELLLRWAEQYVSREDWKRLQARLRQRVM